MGKGKIYAACRGPDERFDEIRSQRVLEEIKYNGEADTYIFESHNERDYEMQEPLIKEGVNPEKIKFLENRGSYANFLLGLAPIAREYNAESLGIATNKFGLERFELYFEKMKKEGILNENLNFYRLETEGELEIGRMEELERQSLKRDKLFFGDNWVNKYLLNDSFQACLNRKNRFREAVNFFTGGGENDPRRKMTSEGRSENL